MNAVTDWLNQDCCPYHRRMARLHMRHPESGTLPAGRAPEAAAGKAARKIALAREQGTIGSPEYSEDLPSAPGWYCYRLWGADGRCLYVGMVGDNGPRRLRARISEHRKRKPWWGDVCRIDAADCGPWGSADEELRQTLALKPIHNVLVGRYRAPDTRRASAC